MERKPKKLLHILPLVASIVFMPAFFVAFCLLYDPFDILEYYSFGSFSYSFHLSMLCCIMLLIFIPTKLLLRRMTRTYAFHMSQYVLWCTAELFVCACFMALYTQLFLNYEDGWFQSLAVCLKYSFLILSYPAAFTALAWLLTERRRIEEKEQEAAKARETRNSDVGLVRLYDEHRRLKLTISPSSILYARSDSNYVSIFYTDTGRAKEYVLRSSMKSVEESLARFGIARCHRSFLVNPKHVSMLGKGDDGFTYATIDFPGTPKIPVSRQYCDSLSALL